VPKTLFLQNRCAAGDVVVLSALFRDIHRTYPGEYELHYVGHCKTLCENNPHIVKFWTQAPRNEKTHNLQYGNYIRIGQRDKRHFLTAFPEEFSKVVKAPVQLQLPKGDLHLSEEEKHSRPYPGRYWVIFPGRKTDWTVKLWSVARWQELVDKLALFDIHCVQTGALGPQFWNPTLSNVTDTLGTDLRQMLSMIYNADGVICPITSGMHVAAALDKPCVVLAGGREAWWWEAYLNTTIPTFGPLASGKVTVPHRYLHTQGLLACCQTKGCWKHKVTKSEPDKNKDKYCELPVDDGHGQYIPKCLEMLSVEHVIEAVMSYYDADGNLLPIGPVPQITYPARPLVTSPAPAPPSTSRIISPPPATPPTPPPAPAPPQLPKPAREAVNLAVTGPGGSDPYEHPLIGGAFTVFLLMYGNETHYHRNSLTSILHTIPRQRRRVRIGCNQVCAATQQWLSQLLDEQQIEKVYWHTTNDKKYPVMRQMFYDPELPIATNYLIWFDDDTHAVDPQWCRKLCCVIAEEHPSGARLYGPALKWHFTKPQMQWLRTRPWFGKRDVRLSNGTPAPNGNYSHFASGWFWALHTDTMRAADIPDVQLGHNGGDYIIGEQLWQAGYNLRGWNNNKQFISCPKNGRRGLVEKHTGTPGWTPGGSV
jgi:hypothetical protein